MSPSAWGLCRAMRGTPRGRRSGYLECSTCSWTWSGRPARGDGRSLGRAGHRDGIVRGTNSSSAARLGRGCAGQPRSFGGMDCRRDHRCRHPARRPQSESEQRHRLRGSRHRPRSRHAIHPDVPARPPPGTHRRQLGHRGSCLRAGGRPDRSIHRHDRSTGTTPPRPLTHRRWCGRAARTGLRVPVPSGETRTSVSARSRLFVQRRPGYCLGDVAAERGGRSADHRGMDAPGLGNGARRL